MVKRRKLETPSAEDLKRYEEEFRGETAPARGPLSAPIAQVAAETAASLDSRPSAVRVADAKTRADAERLREAEAKGLVVRELPVADIALEAMVRDRMALSREELDELKQSVIANGLRLPIEVWDMGEGSSPRWGLLSGYRRLMVFQELADYWQGEKFTVIPALVRDPDAMGGAFAAMVEENEVRSGLTHYERGRISVLSAQQGAFGSVEEAVNALFPVASKAKRSKIRSFALVFEELGDLLKFPEAMKETLGLKLAAALRDGQEGALRDVLCDPTRRNAEDEAALLGKALDALTPTVRNPARGGRPKKQAAPAARTTGSGVQLAAEEDARGWVIRVDGKRVDAELVESLMQNLERLLAPN
ncbi:ParB/RepB/Spo0J family partition protein [Salipiger mangrovisoli]|uniref:Chromosome partitioning protein ParB n=1 Tax=Salipiger mangrovisoli TaxID=2865933 RepID=A0ABR9X0J6_9RHOB|nr:ParB/RepB/Spo0J family partition protein [Salipiger mangrovisoli]MBE9637067.1 chromosome partitioning protein ParB [Salipiger mangrovisoli]